MRPHRGVLVGRAHRAGELDLDGAARRKGEQPPLADRPLHRGGHLRVECDRDAEARLAVLVERPVARGRAREHPLDRSDIGGQIGIGGQGELGGAHRIAGDQGSDGRRLQNHRLPRIGEHRGERLRLRVAEGAERRVEAAPHRVDAAREGAVAGAGCDAAERLRGQVETRDAGLVEVAPESRRRRGGREGGHEDEGGRDQEAEDGEGEGHRGRGEGGAEGVGGGAG
ncbi:hypothetical protein C5D50_05310, partial [Rathayibacter sp. RFBD1]